MTTTLAAPKEALILTGEGYSLTIAPEFEELKKTLVARAAELTVVDSNDQAEKARTGILADLKALIKKTEDSREEIKKPVLKIGREIDAKAKEFKADVETEKTRIEGLIGAHATRVAAAAAEAQRKQQEEERKRQQVELEARRAAEEAERAAKAKEAALWEDDDADAKAKEAEAKRLADEAAAKAKEAEAAKASVQAASLVANTAATGGVKFVPEFEVTDPHALYAAHPDLVELTVKRSPTLARIQAFMDLHGDELPEMPGLKVTKKAKVSTR